jgi:hypothetical protein
LNILFPLCRIFSSFSVEFSLTQSKLYTFHTMTESSSIPTFVRQTLSLPSKIHVNHGFSNVRKSVKRLGTASKQSTWLLGSRTDPASEDQNISIIPPEDSASTQLQDNTLFGTVGQSVRRLASTSRRIYRPGQAPEGTSKDDLICAFTSPNETIIEESRFSKLRNSVKRVSSTRRQRPISIATIDERSKSRLGHTCNTSYSHGDDGCAGYVDGGFVTPIGLSSGDEDDMLNTALRRKRFSLREQLIEKFRPENYMVDESGPIISTRDENSRISTDSPRTPSRTSSTRSNDRASGNTQFSPASKDLVNAHQTSGAQRHSQKSSASSLNDSGYGTIEPYVSPRSTWSSMAEWVTAQDHAAVVTENGASVIDRHVTDATGHNTIQRSTSMASSVYSKDEFFERSSMDLARTMTEELNITKELNIIEELNVEEGKDWPSIYHSFPGSPSVDCGPYAPSSSSMTVAPQPEQDTQHYHESTPSPKQPLPLHEQEREEESRKSRLSTAFSLFREALETFDPITDSREGPEKIFKPQTVTSSACHDWKRGMHQDPELMSLLVVREGQQARMVRRVVEENRVSSTTMKGRDIVDMYIADNENAKVKAHGVRQTIEDSNTPT